MIKYTILFFSIILVILMAGCISRDNNGNNKEYELEIIIGNYTNCSANGSIHLIDENKSTLLNESFLLEKLFEKRDSINFTLKTKEGEYQLKIFFDNDRKYEKEIHVYDVPTKYIYELDTYGIKELQPAN